MKKYIVSSILLLGIITTNVSFAQVLPTDVDPNPNTGSCVSLVNNLRYQSRDSATSGEVSTLQDFLQSKGYLNSEPTGYFGLLTLTAVKKFQTTNGIEGTGYVGPLTRAKIKTISCEGGATTFPPGCTSTSGYSSTTGEPCSGTITILPPGCTSSSGYSYLTGELCSKPLHASYFISSILGNKANYEPGSKISLEVKGYEYGDGGTASSSKGYNVQAYVFNTSDTGFSNPLPPNPSSSYNGIFDPSSGSWKVSMYAPIAGAYNLRVVLYCSQIGSTCHNAGGYGTESVKILPFTTGGVISTPSIKVLSPKNGDQWLVGQTYRVVWEPYGFSADPHVYLLGGMSGGINKKYIGSPKVGTNGLNNYIEYGVTSADLPVVSGYTQGITVCNGPMSTTENNCSLHEVPIISIVSSTTQPSITVISPNGGETFKVGDSMLIKFKATSLPENSKVYIELRPRDPYIETVTKIAVISYSNIDYTWPIPSNISPGQYIIEIYSADRYGNVTDLAKDISDETFSITSGTTTQPSLKVVSPNGGETLMKGTNKTIYWQSDRVAQYDVSLMPYQAPCTSSLACPMYMLQSYSIAKNVYSSSSTFKGSYSWPVGKALDNTTIPNGSYIIQVCQVGTSVCDSSDSYFKITDSEEIIITPTPVVNAMGTLDVANCDIIGGWAVNMDKKSDSMYVNIYDERLGSKNLLQRVLTSGLRQDVNDAFSITGHHGFTVSTPSSIKDGNTHTISAYAEGASSALAGSPKSVSCHSVLGAESFTFTLPLQKGSTGNEVKELQKFLNNAGYNAGLVDGIFGTQVYNAVVKLQIANSLTPDGVVGPAVRAVLNK